MLKAVACMGAIGAAAAVHAQQAPLAIVGASPAGGGANRPMIDLSLAPVSMLLPHQPSSPGRDAVQSRTAIDYRLARDGLFGQVGYVCRSGASPIPEQEASVHMDSKDDRLLGGTLKYPF